ncbi:MAG: ATP synthase subunit C [Smithella sp.]|jgi:V/A-type H+-transporting ATPase subunit K
MTRKKLSGFLGFAVIAGSVWLLLPQFIYAAGVEPAKAGADWMGLAYIGAGLAVGLACLASGIAVARIGSAAIGAVSEKPELMGRTLVFLGLAEGIAIYGLIIAIMIINKL